MLVGCRVGGAVTIGCEGRGSCIVIWFLGATVVGLNHQR